MAFEAYRTQGQRRPTLRRVLFVVVAALHGAVIAAGVVYSYWHVDELTPPTLRVTFMSGAPVPPPPPPPPPAGGGGKPKKIAFKPKTPTPIEQPKPTEIVQPRERPAPVKKEFRKHDDEEEDEDDDAPKAVKGGVKGGILGGVEGGTVGGTIGGTLGGTIGGTKGGAVGGSIGGAGTAPAPAAKFLPPNLGNLQKASGDDPPFPPALRANVGTDYSLLAKICVTTTGAVQSVTLLKKSDPLLNDAVERTVRTWRYHPLLANNTPVPWCTVSSFIFKSHR